MDGLLGPIGGDQPAAGWISLGDRAKPLIHAGMERGVLPLIPVAVSTASAQACRGDRGADVQNQRQVGMNAEQVDLCPDEVAVGALVL